MRLVDELAHEWKTKLGRPAALASLILFALCLLFGGVSGKIERDTHLQAVARHQVEHSGLAPASGSAMDLSLPSYLPSAPLADFTVGQSDLLPFVAAISLWDPDIRLFARYELEDPVSLRLGAFDLSKAILFVLPLVLIALCFEVLSSDRDARRQGLLVANNASIPGIFWSRLLIRAGSALGLMLVISLSLFFAQAGDTAWAHRLPYFGLWMLSAMLYGLFWTALIGFVASRNRRGEVNALLLLLSWAALTLILPAGALAVVETLYPLPSRVALLAESREIEIQTELEAPRITQRFLIDHPETPVDPSSTMPDYFRTAFFVTSAVDRATKPLLDRIEITMAQRQATLARLGFLSPVITMQGVFNDIAGTSSERHLRYMAAARALKAAYAKRAAPYIVAGRRLPVEETANLPVFHLENDSPAILLRRNWRVLLFLAAASSVLCVLASRRLRNIGMGGSASYAY